MPQQLDWPFYPEEQPAWNRRGDEPWDWQTQGFTGLGKHEGRDYGLAQGSPYHASGDGVIVDKWTGFVGGGGGGWGTHYVIRYDDVLLADGTHLDSVFVRTAHMDKAPLNIGDIVTRGQVNGTSGNTGTSTGPHLHLETRTGFVRSSEPGGWPRGDLIDPARVFVWPRVTAQPNHQPSEEDDDMANLPLVQLASIAADTSWGVHIGETRSSLWSVWPDGEIKYCDNPDELRRQEAEGIIRLQDIGEQPESFFWSRTIKGYMRPDGNLQD